jgi:hypothetical protein
MTHYGLFDSANFPLPSDFDSIDSTENLITSFPLKLDNDSSIIFQQTSLIRQLLFILVAPK